MKIAFFSSQAYDRDFFDVENKNYGFQIEYFETHLGPHSAHLAQGFESACVFVNDKLNAEVLTSLSSGGVRWIALRCAGFNQLDQATAKKLGFSVCRVPAYSPYAVSEFAISLLLSLNRKIHKSYARVREQNFSLNGLLGFDLHGKTVGVLGTGQIGSVFAKQMLGFGCHVLACDPKENSDLIKSGVQSVSFERLLQESDIISLHCPLIPGVTEHLINAAAIEKMKKGVVLINTSRGGLIDTAAVIVGLKQKHIGALGLDVYEQEDRIFFKDLTTKIIDDDLIQRLVSFPNVIVTAHQAFFTTEAMTQIAKTSLQSLYSLAHGKPLAPKNLVV